MPEEIREQTEYGLAIAIWNPGEPNEIRLGFSEYTKGGMMFRYSEEFWGPTYDQTGNTPVDQVKVGESATAEVFMAERALEKFAAIFPAARLVRSAIDPNKVKLVWGGMIGQGLRKFSKPLILRPIENLDPENPENDIRDGDVTIYNAVPRAEFEFAFQLQNERIYKVTFTALPDKATGEMWSQGDDSITGDETNGDPPDPQD
ncbi:MAG: hypothetical protein QM401_00705 [Bacillota bacterium]|nr:hypothetical protein [Bacillota bacterium]